MSSYNKKLEKNMKPNDRAPTAMEDIVFATIFALMALCLFKFAFEPGISSTASIFLSMFASPCVVFTIVRSVRATIKWERDF